jgi:hypothetical protein
MAALAQDLADHYHRQPRQTPETVARLPGYREFIDGAAEAGFTGPDHEGDEDFASRSASWVRDADLASLQRWLHSLLRCERWNGEWPDAVLGALRDGRIAALAERLRKG